MPLDARKTQHILNVVPKTFSGRQRLAMVNRVPRGRSMTRVLTGVGVPGKARGRL